jgi:hypothetical protein
LLSTGASGVIFALFGGQPLLIVGVTGPIAIFMTTLFTICERLEIDYLGFRAWVGIWGAIFLIVIAVTNANNLVKYVTRFSCEIFGLLIGVVFIESAVKSFISLWTIGTLESSLLSLLLGAGTFYICVMVHHGSSIVFSHEFKIFLASLLFIEPETHLKSGITTS